MKILINATILSNQNTGLGNYTYKILEYVCPILENKNYDITIICKEKEYLPKNCQKYFKKVEFKNFIQRNLIFNKIANEDYDLIWSTTQHGSLSSKNKQIITIHDLTPLIYPKGRFHQFLYYKFVLPKLIKRCKYIITVSNNTKNDILKYYKNVDANKIKIVYESIFNSNKLSSQKTNILNKTNLKEKKYFCIIGIHYYYKNIHSIIETYNKYNDLFDYKVVIIGNKNNDYGRYLENLVKKYNLENQFIFTDFINGDEKNDLLDNCIAVLYPTKYEGFGLPVLEAMDIGVPIVCSNTSSLPEVGGDAVLYFNPDDISDIHNKMSSIIANEDLRKSLIKKGKQNLKKFNWNVFANEIVQVIDESCDFNEKE